MATDFKLDSNQDVVVVDGDIVLISNGEQIAQAWGITMRTIIGAWFRDESFGVDYFGRILGKTNQVLRDAEFRRVTLSVDGIEEITVFESEINSRTREISLKVRARTVDGEQIELQTGLKVLP